MQIDCGDIVDNITDGIYVVDKELTILFWNAGAEHITGWKSGDVIGSSCKDGILEHVDKDGHRLCSTEFCPLFRSMATEEKTDVPVIVYCLSKSGERIPLSVNAAPFYDADGTQIGGIEIFRDMRGEIEYLERARAIQQEAMGHELPESDAISFTAISHPRDIVGGDFFRIERIDECFPFMLQDVTDHGLPAALYTILIRSLWEEFRDVLLSPERFLAAVSRRVEFFVGQHGYFATGIYGYFDMEELAFHYSSSGGPGFFHRQADSTVTLHNPPGMMLGLVDLEGYEHHRLDLASGDTLLFFSDGAYEVFDKEGEIFGTENLVSMFAMYRSFDDAAAFHESVEKELLKFSGSVILPDDLTLVTVSIT
ncbi:MAG: SpoIIE family protein phosphatase [Spirochaetota bacterium]|nr:MAG: SpoIIE family protein phosphatase [Spirochaetota bacterium]